MSRGGRRRLRVGIIGSGFGGIALAVKLQRRTSAEFTIFEQSEGLGGTWFENRYPGCEVDIPSHAYSFSFMKKDWPRTHATQPELLAYANEVVDRFGLRSRIRLSTRVEEVVWSDERREYTVTTADGSTERFDVVVSAVGLLNVPRYPEWPGLEDFRGIAFHTSRWEPQHDLAGKRVAVVGTGSTAAQVVPALAPEVGELSVYQREPGWIEPKFERAYTPRERWVYRHVPLAQRLHRAYQFAVAGRRFKANDVESRRQRQMRQMCLDYIAESVDDPATRAALTPDYPWGCKRPIVASTYYPAFNRPNVSLVPHPVVRVTETGIVDATGVERPVDVLVLSTGFQPQQFLSSLRVTGSGGRDLHEAWVERATAFLGITVPEFPNFFILYGPNTNGGTSIIAQLERQAEVAVSAIRRLERGGGIVDTDAGATREWVRWIDEQLDTHASAMSAGCHNYYTVAGGANVTQWPRTHLIYLLVTRLLRGRGLRYRR
ncbi:flavin-containing monooxygenase [Homoserinibacter sp. YIM 151385]|uniref:flavin-containing monooxygenase n=1 Tax=Homoserinibacter sp. YIM 151385 TaxID=2985506 RepID=UPI0022F08D89|nr:NAD(P)/FAD-dependent oxidoreductase [Homoserinibacter sp. YIM 151385]WBU37077.1 NAD(P)/FAD-dependent oxidoreductase [Homoserinibacter sp. YIM 151385]